MNLYYFLLVIVSLSCGSLPAIGGDEVDLSRAVLATVGMVFGWSLLCHVGARVISLNVRSGQIDAVEAAGWLEKQLGVMRWLGLGVVVTCLGGFGLAASLDTLPYFADSMFLQSIVLLAPGIAIAFATWSAEHYYGVILDYTDRTVGNYFRSVSIAFRNTLAWLVVPVVVLLGTSDALKLLPISEQNSQYLTLAVIIGFVTIGLPWLIRRLFKTSQLHPKIEHWMASLLDAAGVRGTKPVRWDTGGRTFNAMVAGFIPSVRSLLISDRLLDELPREQVAMVVLHEAAHLRRRHVPLRMLSVLPAWAAGAALTRFAGENSWAMILGSVTGILLTLLILRIVAYRTEYDADVQACRMAAKIASRIEGVPATEAMAAEALGAALMRVTFDQPAGRKATWLHPGVADRVAFMRRVRDTPQSNTNTAGTIANPA